MDLNVELLQTLVGGRPSDEVNLVGLLSERKSIYALKTVVIGFPDYKFLRHF